MKTQSMRRASTGTILLGSILLAGQGAVAQRVTAVPQLDLKQLGGTFYEVARYPTKFEKRCAGQATVLFAEGDGPGSFQMGTFCPGINGTPQENDATGKKDKHGTGQLTTGLIFPFTKKFDVLAVGPGYSWVVIGLPNRKALSILSRTPKVDPAALAQMEAPAVAQGFKTDRLASLPKQEKTYKAINGKLDVASPGSTMVNPQ